MNVFFMKKAFIIVVCCLALTACGKNKDLTGPTIPAGYSVKDRAGFYKMEDCIRYEKQEIKKANVENLRVFDSRIEYAASGNLGNSAVVLYFCNLRPDTNATFTFAVKPVSSAR
jgi:hypothetical protein